MKGAVVDESRAAAVESQVVPMEEDSQLPAEVLPRVGGIGQVPVPIDASMV